jgi:hypothetical protein
MNIDYDCGRLLDDMRPEVEKILVKHGELYPLSQSLRTHVLIAKLAEVAPKALNSEWMAFQVDMDRLRAFLAVHETVRIIERRSRDEKLDVFGYQSP